jgi:hypothetical protein
MTSETLVNIDQTTQRNNPEDRNLHTISFHYNQLKTRRPYCIRNPLREQRNGKFQFVHVAPFKVKHMVMLDTRQLVGHRTSTISSFCPPAPSSLLGPNCD